MKLNNIKQTKTITNNKKVLKLLKELKKNNGFILKSTIINTFGPQT